MSLSDPELDLLLELLEEDPEDEVFIAVAEEYVRRERWVDALKVLGPGLSANPSELAGWALLVRAAAATGQHARAVDAADHLDAEHLANPAVGAAHRLALESVGLVAVEPTRAATAEPRSAAIVHEHAPLAAGWTTPDPMVNADRAEQFALRGRIDRAVRLYRRILFHNPANRQVAERLRELVDEPFMVEDDLSEELTIDEGFVDSVAHPPPGLDMPSPHLGPHDPPVANHHDDSRDDVGLIDLAGDEAVGIGLSGDLVRALVEKRGRVTRPGGLQSSPRPLPPDDDDSADLAESVVPLSEFPQPVVADGDVDRLQDMVKRTKRRRSLFTR